MGSWNITIRGVGAHHNQQYPQDANRMAAKFVKELRDAGHIVVCASFTHGGEDVLAGPDPWGDPETTPEKYLAGRDAVEQVPPKP